MATADNEQSPLLGDVDNAQKPKNVSITKILAGLVGVFLANIDKSVLLATQGEIASSLHSPSSAALLLVAYNLGYCIALPVYGFLSDIYGCQFFLLTAYALFAAGCLLSGMVTTLWPFVLGRVIAGIGGAGMTDLLSVLVTDIYDITQVSMVRSYIMAAGILGQGCGGPLGGLVADTLGWRWTLVGQSPIGVLCLALAHYQLPASEKKTHSNPSESQLGLRSFDWFGLSAFVISMTSFILGTTDGGLSFLSFSTPALLAASGVFLVALVLIEGFWTKHPIIPPSVIKAPSLAAIFLGQLLFFASVNTILTNLPPYFSRIDHLANSAIGLRIWPCALGLVLGSVIAGKAMNKTLKYRRLAALSIAITVVSQTLMVIRWADGISPAEVFYCFPWAVGCGLLFSSQFIALTICSPAEQLASATAVYYLSQQVGLIVGTSLSTTALQHLFSGRLNLNLGDIPLQQRLPLIDHILNGYNFILTLPQDIQAAAQFSYIEAYRLIPASALTLSLIVGAIVIIPKEKPMKL